MHKMKRMQTKKSHSWWWDSHISPKNSKWLAENLSEMDRLVNEMLTLIDEEGDSFAKKAEMYYKRRPELVSHVEDFYRMYRALAERYNNVTGELRKTMNVALHTQGSGSGSDISSEPPSPSPLQSLESTPEPKLALPKPNLKAAGFGYFLGSGGSSDHSKRSSDGSSSSSGSDSDSDDSKEACAEDHSNGLQERVQELENELRDAMDKLREYEEASIISRENTENGEHCDDANHLDYSDKILELEEEVRVLNEKLSRKEDEISSLRRSLEQNISTLDSEQLHIAKLEQAIAKLKSQLTYSELEAKDLKAAIDINSKTHETDLSKRDEMIVEYKREMQEASEKHLLEKSMLETNVFNLEDSMKNLKIELDSLSEEKTQLTARISELEVVIKSLRITEVTLRNELTMHKSMLEAKVTELSDSHGSFGVKLRKSEEEIKRLEAEKTELNQSFDTLNIKFQMLIYENNCFSSKVSILVNDIKTRDDRITEQGKHLHELHLEHAKLILELQESQRASKELRVRVYELENEVDMQRVTILDGAEGKREAIRQLCFSLEHYRDGYFHLCQVLLGNKRAIVATS